MTDCKECGTSIDRAPEWYRKGESRIYHPRQDHIRHIWDPEELGVIDVEVMPAYYEAARALQAPLKIMYRPKLDILIDIDGFTFHSLAFSNPYTDKSFHRWDPINGHHVYDYTPTQGFTINQLAIKP